MLINMLYYLPLGNISNNCDIGSMVSTMPKTVYDSLNLESMVDFPFYHAHANGDVSKITGEVNNIQV